MKKHFLLIVAATLLTGWSNALQAQDALEVTASQAQSSSCTLTKPARKETELKFFPITIPQKIWISTRNSTKALP